jgi:hypothetical protein
VSAPTTRQIDTVQAAADANGWSPDPAPNDWPDRSRQFVKGDRGLSVWFGPKGNLSGADAFRYTPRGFRFRFRPPIHAPQLLAKVLAELAR